MGVLQEVRVPDIGDFKNVPVIEVLVAPGDTVRADAPLIVLESDKATLEVPSPTAGVVKELHVKLGDRLSQGSLVLLLESMEAPSAIVAAPAPQTAPVPDAQLPSATPVASAPRSSGPVKVLVPDIGDFKNVPIIEVLVVAGDTVGVNDSLIVLETDKATMEVPSTAAGVVQEVLVKPGDRVSQGTAILRLAGTDTTIPALTLNAPVPGPAVASIVPPPMPAPTPQPAAQSAPASVAPPKTDEMPVRASPALRKLAREFGVDIARVLASGPRGRITREDIQAHVQRELARAATPAPAVPAAGALNLLPWPQVDFAKFGPVERRPLSRIKKISGANLGRNWVMIPHVTNFDEADITELEAFRTQFNREQDKGGAKLTMLAFLIKACAGVLQKYPEFNASLDGEELVYKGYYHVGFAADTPNGLVVPVIRDADRKGLLQIARETAELAALAREGKLKPADMQGGCFSISSLGGIGGTHFTPIINAPEVAILGVGKARERLAREGERIVSRLILPLSLSWDHRVVDGAAAGRFNAKLAGVMADFRRVVL